MKLNKYIYNVLIIILALLVCSCSKPSSVDITVLYTSDIYGFILPYDFQRDTTMQGSQSNFASLVEEQRSIYGSDLLVLDNGNKCVGTATNAYFNFIDTISEPLYFKAERFIDYDATGIGAHDLEVKETLHPQRHNENDCPPRICANIINKITGKPHFKPYFIKKTSGIKIAVLPMTSPDMSWIRKADKDSFDIEDMVECAQKWVKIIKEKENPDVLIGMFCCNANYEQGGMNIDSYKNPQGGIPAAIKVAGFDLVLIGDARTLNDKVSTVRNYNGDDVTVIQISQGCMTAGQARIHLDLDKNTGKYNKRVFGSIIRLDDYEPSKDFSEEFQEEYKKIHSWFNKPIGSITSNMYGDEGIFGPDQYRAFLHQVQLEYSNADISMCSSVLAGDTIKSGPVNMKKIYHIYPFDNQLYNVKMTGADVVNFLEWGYSNQYETMTSANSPLMKLKKDAEGHVIYTEDGRPYLSVYPSTYTSAGGISYTVDISKPEFHRVKVDSFCSGRPFKLNETYIVAINSYQMGDGGGFISKGLKWDMITVDQHSIPMNNNNIRLFIANYIRKHKIVQLNFKNDWKVIPEQWFNIAKEREEKCLNPVWYTYSVLLPNKNEKSK